MPQCNTCLSYIQALQARTDHDRTDLFDLLISAKLDPIFWDELCAADALRLDYKVFEVVASQGGGVRRIGIASVLQPVDLFLAKSQCFETILNIMEDQDLTCFAVGTFVLTPEPSRDLALFSKSGEHLQKLCDFMTNADSNLALCPLNDNEGVVRKVEMAAASAGDGPSSIWTSLYHQENVKASRKMVAPLIVSFEENR